MDGEAGWWTTSGNIGLPPLARVMGVGRQQQQSRVKLLHKGRRTDELKNYRPIAIINITCKLCMLMVRERIDKWTEDSGMLGEIQGDFRRGRRTEDNLFMLERLIEMVKGRKEEIFVAFLHMDQHMIEGTGRSCLK